MLRRIATAALTMAALAGPAWAAESVERLRSLLLDGSQSDRVRLRAADMLGALDDPRAEAVLVDSLSNPSDVVRFGAARTLGRPNRSTAVEPLVTVLATPAAGSSVRAAAALSLGTIGDGRAVAALAAARQDAAPEVRVGARQALLALPAGMTKVSRFDLLGEIVSDHEAAESARAGAARMLGGDGDPRAMPLLVAALAARAPIGRPVASFGDFLEARMAAKTSLPAAAARALGAFPAERVVPALVRAAPASVGEGRIAILETLAGLRARAAVPLFVTALGDREPRARRWAAFGLAALAEADAAAPLRTAIGDPDDGVRLHATRALATLGDRASVEPLVAALDTERNPQVRAAMEDALRALAPVAPW